MSCINIDGVDEMQVMHLTFQEFIVSYPGCYLVREDGVAIRKPTTVLETNKKYTLVRAAGVSGGVKPYQGIIVAQK